VASGRMLWALEWAWHSADTNLSLVASRPTKSQSRSTRLVMLIKNTCTLWRRSASFCLFILSDELVYPSLRVTGIITRKNAFGVMGVRVGVENFFSVMGVRVGVANLDRYGR